MKSGFDYKEYTNWVKKLGRAESEFRAWLETFLIEQAYRVMAKGKPRTPVDTGALRNSWYVGDINWNGNNLEVEIGVPLEYASYIEYGQRSYEGRYMLTISVNEVSRELPARFNQAWLKFLKDRGVI